MNPEKINYNAFVDETAEKELKSNKGLKINNKTSRFLKEEGPSRLTRSEFEKEALKIKENQLGIRSKISNLIGQYSTILKDRTLAENKTVIQTDLENNIIRELAELGLELDNDETQPEGMGSIGLCNLLLRSLLQQRDIINSLSYDVVQLKKVLDAKK